NRRLCRRDVTAVARDLEAAGEPQAHPLRDLVLGGLQLPLTTGGTGSLAQGEPRTVAGRVVVAEARQEHRLAVVDLLEALQELVDLVLVRTELILHRRESIASGHLIHGGCRPRTR